MVYFQPLFSGSSGNAAYIGRITGGIHAGGVLIDAGRSAKAITTALAEADIPLPAVRAIVLTHSHVDHISGLRVLAKRLGVPIYGSQQTLEAVAAGGFAEAAAQLCCIDGDFCAADMAFSPFDTPHDVPGSMGFRIEADDRTVGYATDLGTVTEQIACALCGCDLVMLEANYDERMLRASSYPYYLQQRIASDHGHLSNDDSAAELVRLVSSGSTRLALAHLSRENNFPDVARQTALSALTMAGMQEGRDYTLAVCRREGPTDAIKL